MLDFKTIYNVAGSTVGTAKKDWLPWQAIDYVDTNVRELCQMGLAQWRPPGEVVYSFPIDVFDLPKMPYPYAHRYWFPAGAGGYQAMLGMPKCRIFSWGNFVAGEPMMIRYYFWANREKVSAVTDLTMDGIMKAVSDMVDVVIPIPSTNWVPPIWKPLPTTLPTYLPDRVAALTAAQIRS